MDGMDFGSDDKQHFSWRSEVKLQDKVEDKPPPRKFLLTDVLTNETLSYNICL